MKTELSIKLLKKTLDVAKEVGVYDKSFIGFGSALGAVRPSIRTDKTPPYYRRGMIPWDHDNDLCFLPLTTQEKEGYFSACKKAGLFNWKPPHTPSGRQARKPDGDLLWFSATLGKVRQCNWFCFEHQGFVYHTKGRRWVEKFDRKKYRLKDRKYDAILKGTPARLYDELTEIDFEGLRVNVPTKIGHLLDHWYPGWAVPKKGGASAKKIVCVVKDWNDKKTWRTFC